LINKDIIEAFTMLAKEKNIDRTNLSTIIEDIFMAIIYKKYGEERENFSVIVNMEKGEIEIYQEMTVVGTVMDPVIEIHIDEAIDLYIKKKTDSADTLVSLYEVDSKCLYAFGIKKDSGNMYSHFGVDLKNLRRQNLPKCYVPNGAIYIAPMNFFAGFYTENTIPFIMNKDASIDIDSLDDLEKASAALSKKM
jgi:hypothetical protein